MSTKLDEVVSRYVTLRDQKKVLKDQFDASVADIDTALEKLENYLLKNLQAQGVESVKTSAGTAYIANKTSATVGDREAFVAWIKSTDNWAVADVKANKTAIKEFRDEHDNLPPGVNWTEMRAVGVRRS